VLTLGVALGAGIGVAGQSSAVAARVQIARIVGATERAHSARLAYSRVSTSTNAFLRSRGSGTGEVDFTTDSMRTSERDRSTGLVGENGAAARPQTRTTVQAEVRIGRTDYMQLSPGIRVLGARWIKTTFPAGTIGSFGVLGQISPLDTLAMDESVRGLRVETLGPARLDGRATTALLVSVPTCAAAGHGHGVRESSTPTEVWVDGRDRLVQARAVTHIAVSKGAYRGSAFAGSSLTGRSTIVEVARLYDFGTPVSVSAPPVLPQSSSSSGSGFIEIKAKGCAS
jgi:hypothetical protein